MQDEPGIIAQIIWGILLFGAAFTGCGFGIHYLAKEIDKVRRAELSNCTAVDAHRVGDLKSGTSGWVVHVNVSVPEPHSQPPYTTQTMSLLKGTNPNDDYFANETFQCYASARYSDYVALTPQKPDGGDILGVVFLSMVSFLLITLLVICFFEYMPARAPPTNSSVRGSEQRSLVRVDTRTSSDSSTTIVAPSRLEACDHGREESSETTPFLT